MKVLVITQYFWPESFRVNELIDALHETGCEITVLTGQPNYPDGKIFKGYRIFSFRREEHNGYVIYRVPMLPRGKSGFWGLAFNYMSFMLSASVFGPIRLRGKKFDIVFAVNQSPILAVVPGIILKKIKKLPLITWIGDLWPQSLESTGFVKNRYFLRQIEKLVRWIYRENDLILLQSATFKEPVEELCGATPVAYLPNPGEKIFLQKSISEQSPVLKLPHGFNVVYAGNIGVVQSVEMILQAAELLKHETHICFVLLGSGSRSKWMSEQVKYRHLPNVWLPGHFDPSAIPGILGQADVLLVSLVKDYTMSLTVPAKTQTYFAVGKPIIAALDGEGARVVKESGAGIAVPAEDAQGLADAVRHIVALSIEEREMMGRAGKEYYLRNYHPGTVAMKLADYMQETIVRKGT